MQLDEQGSKMPEDESLSSGYPETSHSYSVKGNKIDDEEMIAATLRQRGEPSTGLVRGESGRAGTVTLKTESEDIATTPEKIERTVQSSSSYYRHFRKERSTARRADVRHFRSLPRNHLFSPVGPLSLRLDSTTPSNALYAVRIHFQTLLTNATI